MMHAMMPIPPIHAAATSSDVLFWGMISLLAPLFLLATILWFVGSWRIAQRQSQIKEAGRQYDEQPQVHSPQEEILLRR